jgi:hypothetical protein
MNPQPDSPAQQPSEVAGNASALAPAERIEIAKALLKAKQFEEAIEEFGSALQDLVGEHGDVHLLCADAYYQYGNALLSKVSSHPPCLVLGFTDRNYGTHTFCQAEESTDIFGDGIQQAEQSKSEAEADVGSAAGASSVGTADVVAASDGVGDADDAGTPRAICSRFTIRRI